MSSVSVSSYIRSFRTQVVGLLILGLPLIAQAKLEIVVDDDQAGVTQALQRVQALLPEKMQNAIDKRIHITFEDFGNPQLEMKCPTNGVSEQVEKSAESSSAQDSSEQPKAKDQIRGQTEFPVLPFLSFLSSEYKIKIHSRLRQALLAGESNSQKYACGHRSYYRLAIATIVHEIGHVYDHLALKSEQEKMIQEDCRNLKNSQPEGNPSESILCLKAREYDRTVSSRKDFQMLTDIFSFKNKNTLRLRSADSYEFSDEEENFAVNLEYFILDPEFQCRKPALSQYLSQHFYGKNSKSNSSSSCYAFQQVFLNSGQSAKNLREARVLDSSRIYQIHYLLADKGSDASSRWGHAMLRLVICAPERKVVGPDCLQDLGHHLVISYRANVNDIILDYRKGIFGGYASKLFIYQLSEIQEEYNFGELRNLKSAPLVLTDAQKDLFVKRVLEQYWSYSGKYYFIGNNCASETLDLIRSIVNVDELTYTSILTPTGLYDELELRQLIDTSVFNDEALALKNKYLFVSQAVNYQIAVDRIRSVGIQIPDWKDFLENHSAVERQQFYTQAMMQVSDRNKARMVSANFHFLERYAAQRIEKEIEKKIYNILGKLDEKDDAETLKLSEQKRAMLRLFKKYLKENASLSPLMNLEVGSYGVPMAFDFKIAEVKENTPAIFANEASIDDFMKENFNDLIITKVQIQQNLQLFRAGSVRM